MNTLLKLETQKFGKRYLVFAPSPGFKESDPDVEPQLIFTENETNTKNCTIKIIKASMLKTLSMNMSLMGNKK